MDAPWPTIVADMAEDASVSFNLVQEGALQGRPDKKFTLKQGAGNAVRIGRAPGNDIVVEFRGVSQYHAELRLESVKGTLRLCIRDLSMNGTGLQKPEGKVPVQLTKQADEPVLHDSVLLVPMMLKADASESDRAMLRVHFDNPSEAAGVGAASGEAPAANGDGSGEEDDVEKNRMRFVDLLLKTREVNASTTFEDARGLLEKDPAWTAVDEDTRKECFDIFVEHLGSHSKKKDKKKGKEKDKGKKKEKEEESKRRDSRGKRKGSDSEGGKRKGKREKKGGGGSDGSRSRSPDRRRKRRRGHSSD